MNSHPPSAVETLHATATGIFTGALGACNIAAAFDRRLRIEGDILQRLLPDGSGPETIRLSQYKKIFVIALGKAAAPMLEVLLDRLKRRKGLRGLCCSPQLPAKRNWRFRYFEGGHPYPNEESFAAARAALNLLKKARKDTLIFFLISGGGSAMFDLPLDPSITLEETIAFHRVLVASGAPIQEMNTLRKHFSAVKGGRLAIAAPEAAKVNLLAPDVPLRSLDALSSGPTTPDHSTVEDVRLLIQKYDLAAKLPDSVRRFFEREDLPESPGNKGWKPPFLPKISRPVKLARKMTSAASMSGEDPAFRDSVYEILLSGHDLIENARQLAEKAGYHVIVDNTCDSWDYAEAARYLLELFHQMRAQHPRLCIVSGGELTVKLNETPGAGGRNQHFALHCALDLAQHPNERLLVLSAGSDGVDGNTSSAGAIVDTTTVERALALNFVPEKALERFNSCQLLTALGDTIVTGPTGQNLRDLRLLIAEGE